MNAFFQELIHTGIYKRSQGRITRQVTWAAMAIAVALGLWQLSNVLVGWDPEFLRAEIYAVNSGRVEYVHEQNVTYIRIVNSQGQELEKHQVPREVQRRVTQGQQVESDAVLCQWTSRWVRAGIRYGLPGVLLLAGLWITYRIVNVPSFADFLIAVEAEMNKVSWPTRSELFRASLVVLFTIFALALILFSFDWFWRIMFTKVLRIF